MGSIDKALPHAGFYPDSQNFHPDAAKIRTLFETSKYFCRNLHNTPKLLFFRAFMLQRFVCYSSLVASATGLVLFCSFCLELLLLWKNENKMSKKEETPKDWRRFLTPDISGRISR